MSQARRVYAIIQKIRDDMKDKWATYNDDQYHEKCARDKLCGELQAKISDAFPDEFPLKGANQ
jgi:hypothetical protein